VKSASNPLRRSTAIDFALLVSARTTTFPPRTHWVASKTITVPGLYQSSDFNLTLFRFSFHGTNVAIRDDGDVFEREVESERKRNIWDSELFRLRG
jgi:hypothetical protein